MKIPHFLKTKISRSLISIITIYILYTFFIKKKVKKINKKTEENEKETAKTILLDYNVFIHIYQKVSNMIIETIFIYYNNSLLKFNKNGEYIGENKTYKGNLSQFKEFTLKIIMNKSKEMLLSENIDVNQYNFTLEACLNKDEK